MRTAPILLLLVLVAAGCASPSASTTTAPTTTVPTTTVATNTTTTTTSSTTTSAAPGPDGTQFPTWAPGTRFSYVTDYDLLVDFSVVNAADGEIVYEETDSTDYEEESGFIVVATSLAPHGEGYLVLRDGAQAIAAAVGPSNLTTLRVDAIPSCSSSCTTAVTDFKIRGPSAEAWFDNDLVHFPIVIGETWTSKMTPGEDGDLEGPIIMDSKVLNLTTIDTPLGELEVYTIRHIGRIDNAALEAQVREELEEDGGVLDEYHQEVSTISYYAPSVGAIVRVDLHLDYLFEAHMQFPDGRYDFTSHLRSEGGLTLRSIDTSHPLPEYTAIEVLTILREPLAPPTLSLERANAAVDTNFTATGLPAPLFPGSVVKLKVEGAPNSQAVIVPEVLQVSFNASGLIVVQAQLFSFEDDPVPARVAETELSVDFIRDDTQDCDPSTPIAPAECPSTEVLVGFGTESLVITVLTDGPVAPDGTLHIEGPGSFEPVDIDTSGGAATFEQLMPAVGTWTATFTPNVALPGSSVTYGIEALGPGAI